MSFLTNGLENAPLRTTKIGVWKYSSNKFGSSICKKYFLNEAREQFQSMDPYVAVVKIVQFTKQFLCQIRASFLKVGENVSWLARLAFLAPVLFTQSFRHFSPNKITQYINND